MYLADYHVHSTCSQDGRQTMAQAAQAAVAAGLDELCLTDHVDTVYWGPEQKPRWDFDWDAVRRQFRQAQEQWGHRITLRLGAELGEAAMSFQRAEHLMQGAPPLDFVIGSVHMAGKKFLRIPAEHPRPAAPQPRPQGIRERIPSTIKALRPPSAAKGADGGALEQCTTCGGSGCAPGTTPEVCPECHGSGVVQTRRQTPMGVFAPATLPQVRRHGPSSTSPAPDCHGGGLALAQDHQGLHSRRHRPRPDHLLRGQGHAGKNGGPAL